MARDEPVADRAFPSVSPVSGGDGLFVETRGKLEIPAFARLRAERL